MFNILIDLNELIYYYVIDIDID